MSTTALENKHGYFREGIHDGISIAIGYMPIALTFGLLAKSSGLSIVETTMMSLLVFAGASQYIALNLITLGTGSIAIILTTFIVNIRHLLMSASLNEKAEKAHPLKKAIYAFGITDETFSVTATKEGTVTSSYMFGVILMAYSSWVINSAVGHLIGASLPQVLQESMGIAIYAMFIGLLVPALKKQRKAVFLAGSAAVLNSIFTLIFPPSWGGWAIVTATLIAAVVIEWIDYTVRGNKRE
jgi:4-azaleucine resistance transporter AzlC